jgi:signal transduction histidine kinase
MGRFSSLVGRHGIDALVALSAVESAFAISLSGDAEGAPQAPTWVSITGAVSIALPLVLRRRFPFGAPALVWLVAAVFSFFDGRIVAFPAGVYVAGMVAALLLGNLEKARQARWGLILVVASAFAVAFNDPKHDVGELAFTPLLFAVLWVTGQAIRQRIVEAELAQRRALQVEHELEDSERRAILQERTRIAREMHDVVGHSVSVMTVQAAAVRRLLTPSQRREREALLAVEETGREALTEMRRLVTVLREPNEEPALTPPPSLCQLPRLLDHARGSGLPVDLTIEGTPVRLPAGVDLAAYRVIQEGLTNAIRHADADQARVHVRYGRDHLEVEIIDDGRGYAPDDSVEGGHGLAGMRERVGAYHGQLDAGPRPGGGYRVHALLPVHS